jgi:hypothetical protein
MPKKKTWFNLNLWLLQVLDTLQEIQERHDAVKEIEQKLLELQQIFLDMSVLVEAQGEILDNIESQVKFYMPFQRIFATPL